MHSHSEIVIGFDPDNYTVNEADGNVTLFVRLIQGELINPVQVEVYLSSGSAIGKTIGSGKICTTIVHMYL